MKFETMIQVLAILSLIWQQFFQVLYYEISRVYILINYTYLLDYQITSIFGDCLGCLERSN